MPRMMADCRRWPSDTNCLLRIIGEEEEVIRAVAEHARVLQRASCTGADPG